MKPNKNKLIKKIGIGVALSLMTFGIGIGLACEQYNNNNYAVAKAVSYDDELYKITLNVNELNNYTFNNLAEYLQENSETLTFNSTTITYNGNTYLDNDNDLSEPWLQYSYDDTYIDFAVDSYRYGVYDNIQEDTIYSDFEYLISWNLKSSIYDGIKSAIELDIQANAPTEDLGSQLVDAITGGLGLITSLAQQLLLGFSALFWNTTANELTTFGVYACVMLGIAITMSVISLCLNIIRGNTGA